jgi:hypothetical protein
MAFTDLLAGGRGEKRLSMKRGMEAERDKELMTMGWGPTRRRRVAIDRVHDQPVESRFE